MKLLTVVLLISVSAAIISLNGCGVDCNCAEDIKSLIKKRGAPDEEIKKITNGTHELTFRYYMDEFSQTFIWGENIESCCEIIYSKHDNYAPVAKDQTVFTQANLPVDIVLQATDADQEPLMYEVTSSPSHGMLNGAAPDLLYTPDTDYVGRDGFEYKANDGKMDSNIAVIDITIASDNEVTPPDNHAPVSKDRSITTTVNMGVNIQLVATDADNDELIYHIVDQPENGTIMGMDADITYMPDLDYQGEDNFTYKANDGIVDSNTAMVSITIEE